MEASRDYDELIGLADRAIPKQKDPRDTPLFKAIMEAEDAEAAGIIDGAVVTCGNNQSRLRVAFFMRWSEL